MPTPKLSAPFHLSSDGSDRATAYTLGNKAVTLGDKTHVVWTDRVAVTRGRTFDHTSRTWGETVKIGEGTDNHNNPSLTADRAGRLRVAFGPHGRWANYPDHFPSSCFRYADPQTPNSWQNVDQRRGGGFGYHATYASLVHTLNELDCVVYRGGEDPPSLMFQRQRELGGWTKAIELMAQEIPPGYTHYGAQIAADRLGRLFVAGHFYSSHRMHSTGVAVLRSDDLGRTWTDLHGQRADLPIQYASRFAVPHSDARHDPRIGGIAVDSKNRLWVLCVNSFLTDGRAQLSCFDGAAWRTIDIAAFLPRDRAATLGTFTIDHKDRLHVVIDAVDPALRPRPGETDQRWWCHPSTEVFYLFSDNDAESFSCQQVSDNDPTVANWLCHISKPGPFHPVTQPLILWTKGQTGTVPGEGCASTTRTDVFCRFVEID